MPTVYRATVANPPTAIDFTSNKGLGKARRPPRETEELWSGISVFDTTGQCRKVARRWSLDHFIAEVIIPDSARITYTEASGNGHRTAWDDPEEFLRWSGADIMALTYELWDTESRNLVAERMSRDEAISFVRHTLATQGRSAVETLVLGTEDGNGDGEVIARGNVLIDLVEREGTDLKPSATIASRIAD